MGIKICWLWPMGISQWPFQGRDKRVGFWLLCAYFLKIISSKHWCCGVLAPPPCQLSNCTSDWDLGRRDSYSPGCSLFPLRTSSLHHIPHGSPPPPTPSCKSLFTCPFLKEVSWDHPIQRHPPNTSQNTIFTFPHSICH